MLAFYAADTGIETALKDLYDGNIQAGGHYDEQIDGADYKYEAWVTQPVGGTIEDVGDNLLPENPDCSGQYYCIKSTGTYRNVKRAIEVKG